MSEKTKLQDPEAFMKYVKDCRGRGMKESEIARSLGLKTSEYRKMFHEARDRVIADRKGVVRSERN